MAFKPDMMVALMHSYAHPRFDFLDIDARLQWVGKSKIYALNYLDN